MYLCVCQYFFEKFLSQFFGQSHHTICCPNLIQQYNLIQNSFYSQSGKIIFLQGLFVDEGIGL